jgi:hypothetical protein
MSNNTLHGIRAVAPRSPTFARLRAVLARYASSITVDGILASACSRARVKPEEVDDESLEAVLHELRSGIRVFCQEQQIPKLMIELAELLEAAE